jgi:hypothetical protein
MMTVASALGAVVAVGGFLVSVLSSSCARSPLVPPAALGRRLACTPEMRAPVDARLAHGELRAAWDATSFPPPACALEMKKCRLEIAAELGDVSNVEAIAREMDPLDAQLTQAFATARAHARVGFDDLLRDGLAARGRGATRESRQLLDRAAFAATRDSGGRYSVRAVLFPVDATWQSAHHQVYPMWTLSRGDRLLTGGDFGFDLGTGRALYLPDVVAFSPDDGRALRVGSIPLLATTPRLKEDEQLVSLVELGTGRVLFEEPVQAETPETYPDSAYDDALATIAVPLLRDAPYVSLFEGDGPFVRLPGGPAIELATVSRRASDMFGISSLSGRVLVRNDDTGTLWVSHDEDGDTIHQRRRRAEEIALHEAGARLRLLMPDDGRRGARGFSLAVAWSNGAVEFYGQGRRIARYTGIPAPTLLDYNPRDGSLAWEDDAGIHAQLADGRRLTLAPEHRNGCGAIAELSVSRSGVTTSEQSGDVACGQTWDFRTNKSTVQSGASPADEFRDANELATLAKKLHVDDSAVFYRHASPLSLVDRNGALAIVDSLHGREVRKLEGDGDCKLDTVQWTDVSLGCITRGEHLRMWDPKTGKAWPSLEGGQTCSRFAWSQARTLVTCEDEAGRVRVYETKTGRRLFESPPPVTGTPMSVVQAQDNVRCVIGTSVYPFALCESEARLAGLVEP